MFSRRFARALLVAGSCGLGSVALAQTDVALPPLSQVPPTQSVGSQVRLEAIKVEVALLGDPATYSQPVEVRLDHDTILLVGQVDNEPTRKRILEVARQSCYLPVVDSMSTVARTLHSNASAVPLHVAARDALVRQLGSKADRFQIVSSEDGKVTLKGEVGSAEEKLAASRALRGLPGCARVVNVLTVRTVQQPGQAISVVSSDGQSAVRMPTTAKEGIERISATEAVQPNVPQVYRPNGPSPDVLPSGLPVMRTVNVTTIQNGKEVTRPVVYVVPGTSGYATAQPVQAVPALASDCPTRVFHEGVVTHQEPPVVEKRSFLAKVFSRRHARLQHAPTPTPAIPELTAASPLVQHQPIYVPVPTAKPAPAVLPRRTTAVVAPPPPVEHVVPAPVPAEPKQPPAVEPVLLPTIQEPIVQSPPVVSTVIKEVKPEETKPMATEPVTTTTQPAQAPTPTPTPAPAPAPIPTTQAWPPAHDVRPITASPREAVYRSRPLAGLATRTPGHAAMEKVLPAPAPAPVAVPAAPSPAIPAPEVKPVVAKLPPTSASLPTLAPVEVASGPVPMRMTSKDLIDRIKATCGKQCRDVKIETGPDRKIVVHVYAKADAQHLVIGKLLHLPELAASNVRMQVHLAN